MRRIMPALAISLAAMVTFATGVAATGSGGWDHLGHGASASAPALNGPVTALNTDNPGILYAGGAFTDAGGNAKADFIAKWNGTTWSALGTVTLNGAVRAIAYHAGKVYVGGIFTNVGGNANLDFLAVWNGTTWTSPCNALTSAAPITASVAALQIIGNTLYVGGSFQDGAGIPSADFLLACDLTTGTPSSTVPSTVEAFNGAINALAADANGTLYAGGQFINLEAIAAADHVAARISGTWQAMGAGSAAHGFSAVDSIVRSLAASGTNVYVGTDALNIGGIAKADHIARWDALTLAYNAMGANSAGTDGWFPASTFINAIATSGPLVFAAGSFQNANGQVTADDIAYFVGGTWHPLGSNGTGNGPLSSAGNALAPYATRLCVGGNFINAGGDALADSLGCFWQRRPDARIGGALAGPFAGNNVYSATGAGEARTIAVTRGASGTLFVDVQNDGLVTTSFKVTGTGTATGFNVAWFHGATNVTAAVRAGTFSTGSLAPGAHLTLKMVVKLAASSAATGRFLVKATSTGIPTDAVKAVVNAK